MIPYTISRLLNSHRQRREGIAIRFCFRVILNSNIILIGLLLSIYCLSSYTLIIRVSYILWRWCEVSANNLWENSWFLEIAENIYFFLLVGEGCYEITTWQSYRHIYTNIDIWIWSWANVLILSLMIMLLAYRYYCAFIMLTHSCVIA